jgi:Rod binding domain-containing protein
MNTAPIPPIGSTLSPEQRQKIQKTAQDFEAMAIGQLLAPMFQTVDQSKNIFGGGDGEQAWRPMWVSALAKQMEANGGIGLAKPIMQQMLQMQENKNAQR